MRKIILKKIYARIYYIARSLCLKKHTNGFSQLCVPDSQKGVRRGSLVSLRIIFVSKAVVTFGAGFQVWIRLIRFFPYFSPLCRLGLSQITVGSTFLRSAGFEAASSQRTYMGVESGGPTVFHPLIWVSFSLFYPSIFTLLLIQNSLGCWLAVGSDAGEFWSARLCISLTQVPVSRCLIAI
jgi:hypothetical protein